MASLPRPASSQWRNAKRVYYLEDLQVYENSNMNDTFDIPV